MKRISVAIVNHPSRNIDLLLKQLGNVDVFTDTDNNLLINSRKAWWSFNKEADYHLVIEDDAILCNNFYDKVYELLDKTSHRMYNLHIREITLSDAIMKQGFQLDNDGVNISGLAMCLSTKIIPEMLEYTGSLKGYPETNALDIRMFRYARDHGIKIYYPIPCFVEHNIEIQSLIGHSGTHRKAGKYFIDYRRKSNEMV